MTHPSVDAARGPRDRLGWWPLLAVALVGTLVVVAAVGWGDAAGPTGPASVDVGPGATGASVPTATPTTVPSSQATIVEPDRHVVEVDDTGHDRRGQPSATTSSTSETTAPGDH